MACLYFSAATLTDWIVTRISPEQEAEFFKGSFDQEFDEALPPELTEKWAQAEAILTKLKSHPAVVPVEYRLQYSPETMPNAFAVPGGSIVLTRGLLEALDEEIAMAFVIAHELGHFAGRDHLRRMGRQLGFGAALMLLSGGSPDSLTQYASNLVTLSYGREQESAADQFALQCIDSVYGARDGAERLFEILEAEQSLPDWAYMFMTHPANAKRIREIESAE
jgi:Zn-dependent protease with chaperone function